MRGMLAETIGHFLRQLALAAIDDHAMMTVCNDGPPARFVAMDPETGVTFAAFVPTGETVRVNRGFRLIVEPIDQVVIRPLCVVHQQWRVQ